MATHPHGGGTQTRLDRLLAYHESAAEAIRTTIGLLNGSAKAAKTNGHSTVLAEALALDGARAHKVKAKAPAKLKRRVQTGAATRAKLAIRERTARVLALVEEKGPITADEITAGIGGGGRVGYAPLLNAGYLKKVGGNKFKRTAKPFTVDWRTGAQE
jgi:hypothetical protein